MIEQFKKKFPVPILHVWHEDKGFRLAMSRNKSVAAAKGDYIIEIDGDLILHDKFIEDHLKFAKEGVFLKGGRVNLDERTTKILCESNELKDFTFLSRGLKRRINSIHCMALSRYLAPVYKKDRVLGLGCNMSFWKKDFININGYDEFFEGWGGEDYDFASRLMNSGIQRLYLKFSGIVYHLWHEDFFMYNRNKNMLYFEEQKKSKKTICVQGINQYL
jgi:glycosyltransferase involved in cell wall biosynthesis